MSAFVPLSSKAIFVCLFLFLAAFDAQAVDVTTQFKKIYRNDGASAGQQFLIQQINDGNINAVHLLAGILISGELAPKNVPLAVEVLERGAELKDPKSSYLLGKYYSDGNHTKPNFTQARKFFELAKLYGHDKAAAALIRLPPEKKEPVPRGAPEPEADLDEPVIKGKKKSDRTHPAGYDERRVAWSNDDLDLKRVKSVGSGFAISNNGLIATNEHVVNGCSKIFVIYQGKPKLAKLLKADEKSDFAVVNINGATPAFFYFKRSLPELGEQLISGGFPSPDNFGFGIKISTGVVSEDVARIETLFQHTTPTQPGNSGGPLINSSGQLIGISTAVSTVKWGELAAQNVNYAVSNLTAKGKLDQWRLPYKSINDNVEFKVTTLSKHLKKAAVQILCY